MAFDPKQAIARVRAALEAHGLTSELADLDGVAALIAIRARRPTTAERARRYREKKREPRPFRAIKSKWNDLRALVFERDGWHCVYCQDPITLRSGHADHVLPRSRGGADEAANLVASCRPCNLSKGARTPEEWRQ